MYKKVQLILAALQATKMIWDGAQMVGKWLEFFEMMSKLLDGVLRRTVFCLQWPLLLTWFNFNPSMDK